MNRKIYKNMHEVILANKKLGSQFFSNNPEKYHIHSIESGLDIRTQTFISGEVISEQFYYVVEFVSADGSVRAGADKGRNYTSLKNALECQKNIHPSWLQLRNAKNKPLDGNNCKIGLDNDLQNINSLIDS